MTRHLYHLTAALVGGLALPGAALAQADGAPIPPASRGVAVAAVAAVERGTAGTVSAASSAMFGTAGLTDETLGSVAGREDTQQAAIANQVAGVSRNSVGDNVHTGDAKISDNAFQNLSGLSILNVNTGNNVAINAALNVNVTLQPAP